MKVTHAQGLLEKRKRFRVLDRQIERQTNGQIDSQTDRQTEMKRRRQRKRSKDKETKREEQRDLMTNGNDEETERFGRNERIDGNMKAKSYRATNKRVLR